MQQTGLLENSHSSLYALADDLVAKTQELLTIVQTEEDLRIRFENLLEPIKTKLKIESQPEYEKSVYKGRLDAVHGQVIIEYEPPRSFSSKKNIDHAYEQLVNYLSNEAKEIKLTQLVGWVLTVNRFFLFSIKIRIGKQ